LSKNLTYSYENLQKLLPPELLFLAHICTKLFVVLQRSLIPPSWFRDAPQGKGRKNVEEIEGGERTEEVLVYSNPELSSVIIHRKNL